jgi:hypothetical protein
MIFIIRINYQQHWLSTTHVIIDEAILPFNGRSKDIIKMKNKSVIKGFKI